MSRRDVLMLGLLGQLACFGPQIAEGLRCEVSGRCPRGFFCDTADYTCRRISADAGDGDDDGDGSGTAFCADPDIALCLEFEQRIDDGSSRAAAVSAVGGGASFAAGKSGDGLMLDGTYYLDVPDYRPLVAEETIELWVTANQNGAEAVISTDGFVMRVAGQSVEVETASSTLSVGGLSGTEPSHVALRVGASTITLFVNGQGNASVGSNGAAPEVKMTIGSNSGLELYQGIVDQLRVWTRALASSEIAAIAGGG